MTPHPPSYLGVPPIGSGRRVGQPLPKGEGFWTVPFPSPPGRGWRSREAGEPGEGFFKVLLASSETTFRVLGLCALCVLCGSVVPEMRADEFSQTAHYAVRMFSVGTLTLDTRTGDIFIEGWDEPQLEVEAEKVVRAKSEDKAKPLYDRVGIELEGQDKAVRLRTVYPSRKLWRPFRDESTLSVNLRIKMPFEANLTMVRDTTNTG